MTPYNTLSYEKCDPGMPEWTGYDEGCCTITNPCGERLGGCNSDEQCAGSSLVCSDASCGPNFANGEKCCHVKGTSITVQGVMYVCRHF